MCVPNLREASVQRGDAASASVDNLQGFLSLFRSKRGRCKRGDNGRKQDHFDEKILRRLTNVSAVAAMMVMGVVPLAGQEYRAPRGPGGKPDLNGIWQVLNEANFDLEAHVARPAMALRPGPYGPVPAAPTLALGAVGAVPPGLGVVEGDEIPYQ